MPGGDPQRHPEPDHVQHSKGLQELNINVWSYVLNDTGYAIINDTIRRKGMPDEEELPLFWLRFVCMALGIAGDNYHAVIEEYIDPDEHGFFMKYLDNSSPEPLQGLEGTDLMRAKFLSCMQHLQFQATRGAAFLADYQGA